MKNKFLKHSRLAWLRKDLYLENSKGAVFSRTLNGFAPSHINRSDLTFTLTLAFIALIAVPLVIISLAFRLDYLLVIAFALVIFGFIALQRAGVVNFVVHELRDKKREEEIAHRDERLKKHAEKRDSKKNQEENALKKFVFPVIDNNQPANISVFLPSSVWQALNDFRVKFTAVDARARFMPEKDLADLDEVFVAVMNSVIWYDGLSEKLKELDSSRTVEIYTALHKAISFLDEFSKKVDEDFTHRMKNNIEVINSIELDSVSQKVTD